MRVATVTMILEVRKEEEEEEEKEEASDEEEDEEEDEEVKAVQKMRPRMVRQLSPSWHLYSASLA